MSRAHWLALACLPRIGAATVRSLVDRFGDVESIFAASAEELESVLRITPAMAEQLLASPIETLDDELLSLNEDGINLLTWDDAGFPAALRTLTDAPVALFMRGSMEPADARAIAIVGTRTPTTLGAEAARALGCEFASRGVTVVSGMAVGVDTAAHRGALDAQGGRTLGVLGCGIRCVRPGKSAELVGQIVSSGGVLSELHPNVRPSGPLLMARDRIVSGLSRAVIVVEAKQNSGSLDTAARAKQQGRPVFAVAGTPGADQLIASGAQGISPELAGFGSVAETIASRLLSREAC